MWTYKNSEYWKAVMLLCFWSWVNVEKGLFSSSFFTSNRTMCSTTLNRIRMGWISCYSFFVFYFPFSTMKKKQLFVCLPKVHFVLAMLISNLKVESSFLSSPVPICFCKQIPRVIYTCFKSIFKHHTLNTQVARKKNLMLPLKWWVGDELFYYYWHVHLLTVPKFILRIIFIKRNLFIYFRRKSQNV